jgi:hypothetical protein
LILNIETKINDKEEEDLELGNNNNNNQNGNKKKIIQGMKSFI